MQIKKSRQAQMGIAACLVLMFHMVPSPTGKDMLSTILRFLFTVSYIGVDIFFFMSGYMVPYSNMSKPGKYLLKRFTRLMPLFWVSCIAALFTGVLKMKKLATTMIGLEMILKGGASFLWFVPALMILYLLMPLYMKARNKFGPVKTGIASLILWVGFIALISLWKGSSAGMIFFMRIPIFFIGVWMSEYEGKWKPGVQGAVGAVLLISGLFITYNYAFMNKLNTPVKGLFYFVSIPLVIGMIMLLDLLYSRFKGFLMPFLGTISFEMYCVQMTAGGKLYVLFNKLTGSRTWTSILSMIVIIIISYLISLMIKYIKKGIGCLKKKKTA